MRNNSSLFLGVLIGLGMALVLIVLSAWFWQVLPTPANSPSGTSQPSSTVVAADTADLTRRVEKLEQDQSYNLREIASKIDQKLVNLSLITMVVGVLIGLVGWKTYDDLKETIDKDVKSTINKALYKYDIYSSPVYLYTNPKMTEKELRQLQRRLNLADLDPKLINSWEQSTTGVIVVPLCDKSQETEFFRYIGAHKIEPGIPTSDDCFLDPELVGFVVYTASDMRIDSQNLRLYDSLATVNMPGTLVNMILAVGRGLIKPEL